MKVENAAKNVYFRDVKTANQKRYADGFPRLLTNLRELPEGLEPGLSLGLYALARAAGMKVGLPECDVLSGLATKFLYLKDHPECANLSFAPPVDTLFRSLGITWKEITPSDPATAFSLGKKCIDDGKIALARFSEPMIIIGYVEDPYEPPLIVSRIGTRLNEEILSLTDCEKLYWRYPIDEANMLIFVENVPNAEPDLTALVKPAARRAAAQWKSQPLAGCKAGANAYASFVEDLKDAAVDFTTEKQRAWAGQALWSQWSARMNAAKFFERMAPRFGGKERQAITKAGFYYGQCAESWKNFAKLLGPTWNFASLGFTVDAGVAYGAKWRDMKLRTAGAKWVEDAGSWEAKAVEELVTAIG